MQTDQSPTLSSESGLLIIWGKESGEKHCPYRSGEPLNDYERNGGVFVDGLGGKFGSWVKSAKSSIGPCLAPKPAFGRLPLRVRGRA
jgi:hypothetical protein